jgi:membrane protease YdiL (CAAX protease family)
LNPRFTLTATKIEVAAVLLASASNVLMNRIVPRPLQVPAALTAASLLILLARRGGVTTTQLGLSRADLPRGVRSGLKFGIPIGTVAAVGAFLPWTEKFFREDRIVGAGALDAAYDLMVHIPLATAAAEELMFRGALNGIFSLHHSPATAGRVSAALFGLWHILPAVDRTLANPAVRDAHGASRAKQAMIVVIVCTATSVAGLALSWWQRRSGSVATPVIVHFAANGGAFLAGWLAARRSQRASN